MDTKGLTAIDPGVKAVGSADFWAGKLSGADLWRYASLEENIKDAAASGLNDCWSAIVERPQIYRHSKGDPNDLVSIALVAGAWAAGYGNVQFVLPREWKGNVPKEIHQDRILERLSRDEHVILDSLVCPKSLKHNVIDAVGIGLWKLGRL